MNENECDAATHGQTTYVSGSPRAGNKFSSAKRRNGRDDYIVWTRDRCAQSEKPSTGNTFQKRQADDTSTRFCCQEVTVKQHDSHSHFRSPANNQETRLPLSDSKKTTHPVCVGYNGHFSPLSPPTTPKTSLNTPTSTSNLFSFSPLQPRNFVFPGPLTKSCTSLCKRQQGKASSSTFSDEGIELSESTSGVHACGSHFAFSEHPYGKNTDYDDMPWKSFSLQAPPESKTKYHPVQLEDNTNDDEEIHDTNIENDSNATEVSMNDSVDPRVEIRPDLCRGKVSSFNGLNKDIERDSFVECNDKHRRITRTNEVNNDGEFFKDENIIEVPIPTDSRFNSKIEDFTKDMHMGFLNQPYDRSPEINHPFLSSPYFTLNLPENDMSDTSSYADPSYLLHSRRDAACKHGSVANREDPIEYSQCTHSIGPPDMDVHSQICAKCAPLDETDNGTSDKCKQKRCFCCETRNTESVVMTTPKDLANCSNNLDHPHMRHDSTRSYVHPCTDHVVYVTKTPLDDTIRFLPHQSTHQYNSSLDQNNRSKRNIKRHRLKDCITCQCDPERYPKSRRKSSYESKMHEIYDLIHMAKQTANLHEGYMSSNCTSSCKYEPDPSSKDFVSRHCPNRFKTEQSRDATSPALLNRGTHGSVWFKQSDRRPSMNYEFCSCTMCTNCSASLKDRCKRRLFEDVSEKMTAGERCQTLAQTIAKRHHSQGHLHATTSVPNEPKIKERKIGCVDVRASHLSHRLEMDEKCDFGQPTNRSRCACAEVEARILCAAREGYSNLRSIDNLYTFDQFHENITLINESILGSLKALKQMKQFCRNCSENP